MDLPAAFQQIIPMAAGSDPHPYPDSYPVVEASNNGHVHMGEAVAASFSLEEDMLALYEAFYPNSITTNPNDQCLMAEYPSPPLPHPSGDTSGHQLAALQSLQAQQQFQARQQNYYNWQEQHMHQHQQQLVVPRKGSAIRKKKKTEQLKTVYRVAADNILSVDKWAWRKYGQKPIKGSPYPRNYYRCSSSKGCTARKQVERSLTEPQVYVVTYTGDHFHPWPLHRNALAGISRSDHHRATVCSHLPVPAADPRPPSEEPESEVLMIPNSMYVDEDMLRGMQELANSKLTPDAGPPSTSSYEPSCFPAPLC